jgi:hypothetical protein
LALFSAGALNTGAALQAADDAEAAEAEEAEEAEEAVDPASLRNWVDLSIGGTVVDGDTAAMRRRTGLPDGVYGGISSLHYETDIDDDTLFKIDARGIFGNEDYSLQLDLNRYDLGYVRGGIRSFRSYSDGSGGWWPSGDVWFEDLFDDKLHLDRREYWFEAGLRKPDVPEITLRYLHSERVGEKASTHWGDVTVAPGTNRKIVPAFLDLDEKRDQIALDGRHYLGSTTLGLGFRYEKTKLDNAKNLRFNPGAGAGIDNYGTQREKTESDLFNVHGSSKTQFNERVWLTLGYAYTDLDSDTSGYRVYGNGYDSDLGDRNPSPFTFDNLQGEGKVRQHVANLNLYWNIADHLDLVPLVRFEQQNRDASSAYGSPAAPLTPLDYGASSDRGLLDVAGGLELRYRGLTNVAFYARGDWLSGRGDLDETWDNITTGGNLVARSTDDERFWQKYSVGANWYPHRRFSLGGGYFYKVRENDFDHTGDNTPNPPPSGNRYPAYLVAQRYALHDANVRATWRPRLNLTMVARYDLQLGELQSEADGLSRADTADVTSHVGSLSISWVPVSRLYLQGRGSYITDQTESAATDFTAAVLDAENDYWTGTGVVGYALSNEVDLEGAYTYYRSDNFNAGLVAGQPYGAGLEEHWASATLTWRMNARVRWLARYGYGVSKDDTSGGNNDYDVHLLQASMQYRF